MTEILPELVSNPLESGPRSYVKKGHKCKAFQFRGNGKHSPPRRAKLPRAASWQDAKQHPTLLEEAERPSHRDAKEKCRCLMELYEKSLERMWAY